MNPPSPVTILRTAAGSPPGVSQYLKFQELGVRVVAVDAQALSSGFYFADAAHLVPRAAEEGYVDALLGICRAEGVTAVLPALDEELLVLSRNRARFDAAGVLLLLSGEEALATCTDKWTMFTFFRDHGIPTPETWKAEDVESALAEGSFPFIVKPRSGRGSTGVHLAKDESELRFFARQDPEGVIQRRATGMEYTIDVLADDSGEPCIIAPRKRLATDSGISSKGIMAWDENMVRFAAEITRKLCLVGPANIQCFLDGKGEIAFTEVNARLAGSAILSIAAGVPLIEGIVNLCCGQAPPVFKEPAPRRVMLRYWSELFLTEEEARRFGWEDR